MRNTKIPHSGSKLACVAGRKKGAGGQGETEGEGAEKSANGKNPPPFSPTFPQSYTPFSARYAGCSKLSVLPCT